MKKIIAKTASVLLAFSLAAACLASCGDEDSSKSKNSTANKLDEAASFLDTIDGDDDSEESEAPKGETKSHGVYKSVYVPAEWTFRKGDATNNHTPNTCGVMKNDTDYVEFRNETENTVLNHYEDDKASLTDKQVEIAPTKIGSFTWQGFSYSGGFEIYTDNGTKHIRACGYNLQFDSPEVQSVLESFDLK